MTTYGAFLVGVACASFLRPGLPLLPEGFSDRDAVEAEVGCGQVKRRALLFIGSGSVAMAGFEEKRAVRPPFLDCMRPITVRPMPPSSLAPEAHKLRVIRRCSTKLASALRVRIKSGKRGKLHYQSCMPTKFSTELPQRFSSISHASKPN